MKKNKKKNYFLKEAASLSIVALLVFSTLAVMANTSEDNNLVLARSDNSEGSRSLLDEQYLSYDSSTNVNAIGLTNGGTFYGAIRLTPTELGPYDGYEVTKIRWHHGMAGSPPAGSPTTGSVYLREAGTPTSPGPVIVQVDYDPQTENEWLDIDLPSPHTLDVSEDLWVVVKVTHQAGEFPLGVGPGPAVPGKGIWISMNGISWDWLPDLNPELDYNWNMGAVVSEGGGPDEYTMKVENSSALPGDIGRITQVTGSWTEEIFGYYIGVKYGPMLSTGDITLVNVTLDGCVAEGGYYFAYTSTNYGTWGLIDITAIYAYPFDPGTGIPAGDGDLVNIVFDIDGSAEPQIINITAAPMSDSHYWIEAGVQEYAEFIDGYLEILAPNQPPETPAMPSGPTTGFVGIEYDFGGNTTDPDGDDVSYMFDWGDGNYSDWTDFVPSGTEGIASYSWNSPGSYNVKVKAKDIYEAESDWSIALEVQISESNNPPETPGAPDGPDEGEPDVEYTFTGNTTDPDGDDIAYMFDWGDGNYSDWTEFVPSGTEGNASYTWSEEETYDVRVKAKDINGEESGWSPVHTITIEEESLPDLNIKSIEGGKGITVTIENNGDGEATGMDVNITIEGGLIIFPGEYEYPDTIAAGESVEINMSVFGIGLGIFTPMPEIKVTVECAEGSSDSDSEEARIFLSKVTIQE